MNGLERGGGVDSSRRRKLWLRWTVYDTVRGGECVGSADGQTNIRRKIHRSALTPAISFSLSRHIFRLR
jgi:hypothetical protein